jgi:hypothetical protein
MKKLLHDYEVNIMVNTKVIEICETGVLIRS